MLPYFSQKNLLSSSFLVLSFFLLSPEGKAMDQEYQRFSRSNKALALDEKFVTSQGLYGTQYKDLPSENPHYQGRSALYNARYPKASMVHHYHHGPVIVPFSGYFPEAYPSFDIKEISKHKKIYSFVVQAIGPEQPNFRYSLKPQYFIDYNSPNRSQKTSTHKLQWTVIPGAKGNVEPLKGNVKDMGLLSDTVSTHPTKEGNLVLSGDTGHLKGINSKESVDFTSLVAFEDKGEKIAAVTYHWLLNPEDLQAFRNVLLYTDTFHNLIANLEQVQSFHSLLDELKKYVGILPRKEVVVIAKKIWEYVPLEMNNRLRDKFSSKNSILKEENGALTVTTDNSTPWSYQVESEPFDITEKAMSKISFRVKMKREEKDKIGLELGVLRNDRKGYLINDILLNQGKYDPKTEEYAGEVDLLKYKGQKNVSFIFYNGKKSDAKPQFTVKKLKFKKEETQKTSIFELNNKLIDKYSAKSVAKTEKNGDIMVTSDNSTPWSYQAESTAFDVKDNSTYILSYKVKMKKEDKEKADLDLGVLSGDRTKYLMHSLLQSGQYNAEKEEYTGQVEFSSLKELKDQKQVSFIFYNSKKSNEKPQFTIKELKCGEKEDKPLSRLPDVSPLESLISTNLIEDFTQELKISHNQPNQPSKENFENKVPQEIMSTLKKRLDVKKPNNIQDVEDLIKDTLKMYDVFSIWNNLGKEGQKWLINKFK